MAGIVGGTGEELKQYTLAEAAAQLGMSRQGVWLNIVRGRIKAGRFGRSYTISLKEIERFKNEKR